MAATRQGLSDSQVEKAFGAIQYLSSLQIPSTESGSSGGVYTALISRRDHHQSQLPKLMEQVCGGNIIYKYNIQLVY